MLGIVLSLLLNAYVLSISIDIPKQQSKEKSSKTTKVKMKKDKSSKNNDLYIVKDSLEKLRELNEGDTVTKYIADDCDTYYMGVGLTQSLFTNKVIRVARGGPADIAGIKSGDQLAESIDTRDKYSKGTTITIPVIRDGTIHDIPVTIGKICTK